MSLVSKWADDPELVQKAQEQDTKKIVTVKKGEKLVSRWATPDNDKPAPQTEPLKTPTADEERMKAIRDRQLAKKKAAEQKKLEEERLAKEQKDKEEAHKKALEQKKNKTDSLLARLDKLSLEHSDPFAHQHTSPKKSQKKTRSGSKHERSHSHGHAQDQWEDDVEDKQPPTKAGLSLASRLGISSAAPQSSKFESKNSKKTDVRKQRELERQKNKEKKEKNTTEWHQGKHGTKIDYSNESTASTVRPSKTEKSKADLVSYETSLAEEMKMIQDIAKGDLKMDWADFDD